MLIAALSLGHAMISCHEHVFLCGMLPIRERGERCHWSDAQTHIVHLRNASKNFERRKLSFT